MKHHFKLSLVSWFRVLTILLCVVASGCSTFNRDWNTAAKQPTPLNDIQGRWEGKWLSEVNGHTGKLRCLLTRLDDAQYKARYRATYSKILRFSYDTYVTAERTNESFRFHGDTDLGSLAGGVYHYDGVVSPTNFFSTYKSKYDHGTFQMTRPP